MKLTNSNLYKKHDFPIPAWWDINVISWEPKGTRPMPRFPQEIMPYKGLLTDHGG